jgi:hypothetical protein
MSGLRQLIHEVHRRSRCRPVPRALKLRLHGLPAVTLAPAALALTLALASTGAFAAVAAAQEKDDQERTRSESARRGGVASGVRYVFAGIGIDDYVNPPWQRLINARNDLERVQQTLTGHLGFHTEPGLILRDEDASYAGIKALVEDVLPEVLRGEDRLVLFYAGHGAMAPSRPIGDEEVRHVGYLVPRDATDHKSSWIRLAHFLDWVDDLPAQQILVVLDACHAGFALDPLKADTSTRPVEEMETLRGRRVLVSAKAFQLASDGPIGRRRAADGGERFPDNTLFTGWLTEGLRGATTGSDTATEPRLEHAEDTSVSSQELYHFVLERLQEGTGKQTPAFGPFESDRGGQLVFPLARSPGDVAYDRAIAALGGDPDAFLAAAEAAIPLLDNDDARRAYLRYRVADENDKLEAVLAALLELRGFADQGESIEPMTKNRVEQRLARTCKVLDSHPRCSAPRGRAAGVVAGPSGVDR